MTFFWYDLETFGLNPQYDRIAQFAGVRTDENLQIIEEPVLLHGRLSPDYLPDIDACLITGITPQIANKLGMSEAELVEAIDKHLSVPGTCAVGYNSIAFDDEFIRNLYYRNLRDPYAREWENGNSRWDLINLTRATRDLRPKDMNWPPMVKGRISVRLELLARANGIKHERSHNALSDVYATIDLARLMKERRPGLFDWTLQHRGKEAIRSFVESEDGTPLIYTSYANLRSGSRGNTSLICPIAYSPIHPNTLYAFDLSTDPQSLFDLDIEEVCKRVFSSQNELDEFGLERIPLRHIKTNKCPFLAPMSELTNRAAQRLRLNVHLAIDRCKRLQTHDGLEEKVLSVFARRHGADQPQTTKTTDSDFQIYEGFFPNEDKQVLKRFAKTSPEKLKELNYHFEDARIPEMIQRYVGRNFPELLNKQELQQWERFCSSRLAKPPLAYVLGLNSYKIRLAERKADTELATSELEILQKLEEYAVHLEAVIGT